MSTRFVARGRRRRVLVPVGNNLGMTRIGPDYFDTPVDEPYIPPTAKPYYGGVVHTAVCTPQYPCTGLPGGGVGIQQPATTPVNPLPLAVDTPPSVTASPGLVATAKTWVMDHKLLALLLALAGLYVGSKVIGGK